MAQIEGALLPGTYVHTTCRYLGRCTYRASSCRKLEYIGIGAKVRECSRCASFSPFLSMEGPQDCNQEVDSIQPGRIKTIANLPRDLAIAIRRLMSPSPACEALSTIVIRGN